ncbi:MAG: nucleotidyl transferase AbiEii/AbiGii toxin family protein [bacterium]|nr:nucleotidyl transferase AbiEii/AbiGii toxin family protein [bacterium]
MLKPTKILTSRQLAFLDLFSESQLRNNFYLSGGTALCGFYYPYRYSEDLDFFSLEEFAIQGVVVWLRSIKQKLGFSSFDAQQAFNRNLVFLEFGDETLKTEFTYYPFPTKQLERYKKISVDTPEDIALNKLFTIYQQPRLRDFFDLFVIQRERPDLQLEQLRLGAKAKFDWDIDVVQLGAQILKVKDLQDEPVLLEDISRRSVEVFFLDQIKSLSKEIMI